jgi:hypothetical protein
MNKKELYHSAGILLIIIGIFIIISQPFTQITGAVIDISTNSARASFFIGIFMIIGGIVLAIEGRLEAILEEGPRQISVEEFVDRIKTQEPDAKRRKIILDSSVIRAYEPYELGYMLDQLGQVYLSELVFKELPTIYKNVIKNRNWRGVKLADTNSNKLKKIARDYISRTEKPRMYEALAPILDDVLSGKRNFYNLTPEELELIATKTEKLKKLARRDKFDMRGRGREGLEKTREYLERNCRLSEADVATLALAIDESSNRYHPIIGEMDTDYRDSIDLMKSGQRTNPKNLKKREYSRIAENIDYVEPYPEKAKNLSESL